MPTLKTIEKIEGGLAKFKRSPQNDLLQNLAKNGQHPEAIVVTCADSRVPPELLFAAEVGQLFVIRVAGNVVGPHELASIEYAALALNVPLCMVLGHSSCGAVAASVDWYNHKTYPGTPSLESLVKDIEPAVAKAAEKTGAAEEEFLSSAIAENVRRVIQTISTQSPKLSEKIQAGEFVLKGGVVNMNTSTLDWLS